MGPYQQARHLLRLLERVLKVLGWLTTPDWQVGQHQLQVRGFDGAQQEERETTFFPRSLRTRPPTLRPL